MKKLNDIKITRPVNDIDEKSEKVFEDYQNEINLIGKEIEKKEENKLIINQKLENLLTSTKSSSRIPKKKR